MIRVASIALAGLLAIASTAAFAFQEQQAPSASRTEQQSAPAVTAAVAPDAEPAAKGTPVRIPGLGTLAVIPKMDFGLELLYGAADTNKRSDPLKPDGDDVLVGGRIKHKF